MLLELRDNAIIYW